MCYFCVAELNEKSHYRRSPTESPKSSQLNSEPWLRPLPKILQIGLIPRAEMTYNSSTQD